MPVQQEAVISIWKSMENKIMETALSLALGWQMFDVSARLNSVAAASVAASGAVIAAIGGIGAYIFRRRN